MPGTLSRRATEFLQFVRRKVGIESGQGDTPGSVKSGRTKHVVRPGETVDRICGMMLGDERFSSLVITINRASIVVDRRGVAFTEPGTTLELPNREEMRLYRENFLSGRRKVLPPRIAVNQKYLSTIVIEPVDPYTFELRDDGVVTQLSDACRIYSGAQGPIGTQFSIKLQASFHNGFLTIAAYESILGRTKRITFRPDGSCAQFEVDLPSDVAVEMAKRDFHRNWKKYYDAYFLTPASVASYRSPGAYDMADF